MRSLADNRNIVLKEAHKEPCEVAWDRNDYLMEDEKQLSDKNVYKEVNLNKKLIQDLRETNNKMSRSLKNGRFTTNK